MYHCVFVYHTINCFHIAFIRQYCHKILINKAILKRDSRKHKNITLTIKTTANT